MNISNADYLIIAAYYVIILISGIYVGRNIKDIKDYTSAYKKYSPFLITLSLMSTLIGGGSTIGTTAEIYSTGIIFAIASLGYAVNSFIVAKFIAPKIDTRFDGMISASDVIKYFYGNKAEKSSAIIGILFDLGIIASQLMALGHLLSLCLQFDYKISIIIAGIIMITYSAAGGIKSIVITDIIKLVLIAVFIPILANTLTYNAGGIIKLFNNTPTSQLQILDHPNFSKYFIMFIFVCLPIHMFQPQIVQRFLMARNTENISKMMYIYGLIKALLIALITLIALSCLNLLPGKTPKEVIYYSITTYLPTGIKGLTIAGLIAVVMCTGDSHLNSSSIILSKNLLPQKLKKHQYEILIIRITTIILGILSLIIATRTMNIMKLIIFAEALWGITVGLPLIAGIIELRIKPKAFWIHLSTAFVILITSWLLYASIPYSIIIFNIVIGTAIFVFFHLNQKKQIQELKEETRNSLPKLAKITLIKIKHLFTPPPNQINFDKNDYFVYAVFCIINYIFPYYMWNFADHNNFETSITLRSIAGIACVILLLKDYWPQSLMKYFYIYWQITLFFTLPFMSFFMVLIENWAPIWLINAALALFLLNLLTNWYRFIFMLISGIVISVISLKLLHEKFNVLQSHSFNYMVIYSLGFIIIICLIFTRRKENYNKEMLGIAEALSGMIAHEMRTSLLTIKNYINGLDNFLPILTKAYTITQQKNLTTDHITVKQFKVLENLSSDLNNVLKKSFSFIDTLLINVKGPNVDSKFSITNMSDCVKEALETYPFMNKEKEFIEHYNCNFMFLGNKEIVVHIIFNLLNNALYNLKIHHNPHIRIWSSFTADNHLLHFKDNGSGIDLENIDHIFKRFYSRSQKGTGLGLSFCKLAMNMFMGDIKCKSKKGAFTEFILKFPKHY